jgi:predicted AAA+ superfamily ATPase
MQRIQLNQILKDLTKKMVFLAGPRQVGKTFIAKEVGRHYKHSLYLNYDELADRKLIKNQTWLTNTDLLILDELHKMRGWKNYLKGLYDTKPEKLHILVTGSARLDILGKVGDSLAGRYFLHHLLPLSLSELKQTQQTINLDQLLTRGGFPEPYLTAETVDAERWRLQYSDAILTGDVFEVENLQSIQALRLLFELLRTKVGSSISYQSLAEDIGISPITVKKYINVLEILYVVFRVTPFSKNIARSLIKEPKIYFFDNGLVKGDVGAQLENLTAVSLLKHVYAKIDYAAERYSLYYLKTKEAVEVDFALAKDNKIEQIIEVKHTDSDISKALYNFHKKYHFPAVQIVKELRHERQTDQIKVLKAESFLTQLAL